MTSEGRILSDYEMVAWDEYEAVLDTIPQGRMYDRISLMKAFPKLQAAFDRAVATATFYRLSKDYNE